ncbi:MAG: DEAD/DEAH box helicase [Myxococcales bacterium]|nr:DEAD/DEAH box helicase [Myxococcales bacterium]HIK86417.1 DEAD/DEAH box helicase [Myxococcales bacterium]
MTELTELSELFADIAPDIQKSIRELGWNTPTPVQAAAIPKMRAGGDLIVQAETGSGKTGAFGIPLVEAIDTDSKITQAIVLLPTRELANQVAKELDQLGQHRGVRTLPIYGGIAYGPQLEGLERGAHIVVGTPGRILDHLKNNRMDLSQTKILVLDEADEMLSLGFWPDMKDIASFLPKKRQSHLFSATMPERVRSLSRYFLNEPEDVTIDGNNGRPQLIEHYYYVCAASEKEAVLSRILQYEDPDSAIIFCNTKADVRFITAYLAKRDFNIDQISGDLAQSAREKAIAKIKSGNLRFLVATDVAARGIDISDLAYVINYTTSDSPEVYVHRTGRTGRAGKSGVAVSLVSGLDIGNFKHMQIVNGIKIAEKKVPTERGIARRKKKREEGNVDEEIQTLNTRAESELADLPGEKSKDTIERILPVITKLAGEEEGVQQLASICAAYILSDAGPKIEATSKPNTMAAGTGSDEPSESRNSDTSNTSDPDEIADNARADERPDDSRRRRSGRSGGGARSSSGDGARGRRGGSGSRRS